MSDMTSRVILALAAALPGVRIIPPNMRKRERCVVYRVHPAKSEGTMRSERIELRFVAESLAEARRMYRRVREAIVSDGDAAKVGTGMESVVIREVGEGGGSGYIIKTGLYFVSAGFLAMGYDQSEEGGEA